MNASGSCILVSRIVYGDEMNVSLKGSDCLNAENACSDHGILTSILTVCLKSEMKIILLHGECLSFKCDLLDLFRCDEDPWDLGYELLLDGDQCLHLSSLFFEGLNIIMILVGWREFFIFPFDGTSSSDDSPSLLELLNDNESSDSGFCCLLCSLFQFGRRLR